VAVVGSEAPILEQPHRTDLVQGHDDSAVLLVLAQERDEAVAAHRGVPVLAVRAIDPKDPSGRPS